MVGDAALCSHCSQPLIYIGFRHHFRAVCDNGSCLLFREGRGIIERDGDGDGPEGESRAPSYQVFSPNYQAYLARGQESYHFARTLKVPSIIARDLRWKTKEEIKAVARRMF